jgi:2-succinyl-5-enolpyruvyl-6-hydroxy-3-cyclohexene-1-carboxylate synthase
MHDHLSWTSHLFRAFYSEGVRNIYISPGSRSTPLVLAVASHPGFTKRVILDERSAAFQALGCAKASGIPSLLICTSGTALANYHPAIIESKHAGIPLIVISADRPPHLRNTGSSQTIDQVKIFSESVKFFHELGEPVHDERDYNRLTLLAKQVVRIATDQAGTVHINAPFRKPLEPADQSLQLEKKRNLEQVSEKSEDSANSNLPQFSLKLSSEVFNLLEDSVKPLLIAGPDERSRSLLHLVAELSHTYNIPVIAEPGSHLPESVQFIDRFDILFNNNPIPSELVPDLIIKTGNQPFTKSLQEFELKYQSIPMIQFLSHDTWQNPFCTASHRIVLDNQYPDLTPLSPKDKTWSNVWIQHNREADSYMWDLLENEQFLTDGHVFNHITSNLTTDWDIVSSNSMTVRDLSLFGQGTHRFAHSFVNRGAAGIDGILSTARGIQHYNQKKTLVFIGDLALLHDSNALLNIRDYSLPLVIVVLNNGGGTIFRMLPIYGDKEYFESYFETPQHVDLASLAKMHNISFQKIQSIEELNQFTPCEAAAHGPVLIECKTDPDKSMELRNILWNR